MQPIEARLVLWPINPLSSSRKTSFHLHILFSSSSPQRIRALHSSSTIFLTIYHHFFIDSSRRASFCFSRTDLAILALSHSFLSSRAQGEFQEVARRLEKCSIKAATSSKEEEQSRWHKLLFSFALCFHLCNLLDLLVNNARFLYRLYIQYG